MKMMMRQRDFTPMTPAQAAAMEARLDAAQAPMEAWEERLRASLLTMRVRFNTPAFWARFVPGVEALVEGFEQEVAASGKNMTLGAFFAEMLDEEPAFAQDGQWVAIPKAMREAQRAKKQARKRGRR